MSRRPGPRPEQRAGICSGGYCGGCQASEGEDQRGAAIVREQGPSVMGISGLAESQPSNKTWGYSDVTPPPNLGSPRPLGGTAAERSISKGKGRVGVQGRGCDCGMVMPRPACHCSQRGGPITAPKRGQGQAGPTCLRGSEPSYCATEFCTPSSHLTCCHHHTDQKQGGKWA